MKTSELIGPALDWAVAKCEGKEYRYWKTVGGDYNGHSWQQERQYSTDWSQGGPIIEREEISFRKYHNPKSEAPGTYYARVCRDSGTLIGWYKTTGFQQTGPTPLIAAMRCYVASKLGDEIDIPKELL